MASFQGASGRPGRPAFLHFDGRIARLAFMTPQGDIRELKTEPAKPGEIVYLDLGHGIVDELCRGAVPVGPALVWSSDTSKMGVALAADFGAAYIDDAQGFMDAVSNLRSEPKPDVSNVVSFKR